MNQTGSEVALWAGSSLFKNGDQFLWEILFQDAGEATGSLLTFRFKRKMVVFILAVEQD